MIYNINPICAGGQAGPPKAALRIGNWKILSYCYSVVGIAGGKTTGPHFPTSNAVPAGWPSKEPVLLYDLSKDPSETVDVAADHPEVVAR